MSRKERAEMFVDEGYNATVTGRHILVTDAIKAYAIEKLSKIERFSPRLIDVEFILEVQRAEHRAEIIMQFNDVKIVSHATTDDMYASIDLAVEKIQSQIRRYKSKIQDHHAKSLKGIDLNVNVIQPHRDSDLEEINGDIEEANQNSLLDHYGVHRVVAKETLPMKTLTLDEAIMKLDLSGNSFLIYRNEEDHKIKVIYRRKDGNFGVIEPEV